MVIISTDGSPVLPEPIDTLYSTSGERYDFVVEANQEKGSKLILFAVNFSSIKLIYEFYNIGDYWVRVTAIGACNNQRKEQFAVFSYADKIVTDEELAFPQEVPPAFDDLFTLGTVGLYL